MTPTIQQWAGFYQQSLGWSPVPLAPRTKDCYIPGWPTRDFFAREEFLADSNLGIKSVNGLVVLDDDLTKRGPQWKKLGDAFLPHTRAVYGRPSAQRSKRLYLCPALTACQTWTDIDQSHLHQLRVGVQDMAPPSGHPDTHERLQWDGPLWHGMLDPVDEAALITACNLRAAVALVALHWPAFGRRKLRLAYARVFLETLGLSDDVAEKVLTLACEIGGSDDRGVAHAARAVRDTRDALTKNDRAIGATYIRKVLPDVGAALLHQLRGWFGKTSEVEEAIEDLNDTHALIWQQSGSLVVLTEDIQDGEPHLRFSKPGDMALIYPELLHVGEKKNGDPICKPRGSVWLTHPQRRFYRGIEVAPNDHGNVGYYNMWRGFSVEPKKGEWPLFREHLDLVANHDPNSACYILAWMAETVQHPDRPVGTALAFKGKQGTGKSTFAKWFGALFGVHFLHLDSEQTLLGRFNAHLHNTLVLLADEAVWAGGKAGLGALKRMITEDTLNIEKKNVDILTVKNMLHMMVASNEKWVVPAGFDNRRFAIFGTSEKRINDKQFFAAVHKELFQQGGAAALLYDLLNYVCDFNLYSIPETADLQQQKALSADLEEKWWLEKLHQGYLTVASSEAGTAYQWPKTMSKEGLHADFLLFLDKHHRSGRSSRATETELGTFLKTRTPLSDGRGKLEGRKRHWNVPSLDECRKAWSTAAGWPEDYAWDE